MLFKACSICINPFPKAFIVASEQPAFTNRLATESSPYLRQHAHNPVDWYPWGREAFDKARAEDKPVFLSIGYSTCHWCHVMEHESFDDEAVAEFLNQQFVSIKLDREQRPDLDDIYMTGVQMLTGQGGWPMSNFLTADGKPFFAGTYFPRADFLNLLAKIADAWQTNRAEVLRQADEIAASVARFTAAKADAKALPGGLLGRAGEELLARVDDVNGGFGGAPKFPNESSLLLLTEDWCRNGHSRARDVLTLTLDKMCQGGIYDQIAGGFHRYTVDAIWLVPHFEKMLYNQAQLVRVYARMAANTGNAAWRRVVEQTVDYLMRDMRAADGAFYSATDADSEGEEGLFFLWTPAELDAALSAEDAALVKSLYGVTQNGNFEGRNILCLDRSLATGAQARGMTETALWEQLVPIHSRLYSVREQRAHPLRDEKIITGWNGMMITSLAIAGFELERPDYLDIAVTAADFLWEHARDGDGPLWRICFEGQRSIPANLEDYAYFSEAALTLYLYGAGDVWLNRGRELVSQMLDEFRDVDGGGFFLSRDGDEGPLITRPKSPMDGAMPSANSVALASLVLLHEMTGDIAVEQCINEMLAEFSGLIVTSPSAFTYMIVNAERYLAGSRDRVQFAGNGKIRASCLYTSVGTRLELVIAEGWHINANEVSDESLIPTRVVAGDALVTWPAAVSETYASRVTIEVSGKDVAAVDLTLQPCSGDLCLAPETLRFR